MAINIFDKYGIKEVANVFFEALEDDPKSGVYKGDVVLYLDSLKVSTIETTAENVSANGGWGNPRLIMWDYNKEINLTLEDALISLESLRFMMGGAIKKAGNGEKVVVHHNEEVVCTADGVIPAPRHHLTDEFIYPKATYGHPIRMINLGSSSSDNSVSAGSRTQIEVESANAEPIVMTAAGNHVVFKNDKAGVNNIEPKLGDHIRIFWEDVVDGTDDTSAVEVTISPDTFPGTYKVVGDTFMRSEKTGKDEAFQFIIPKAKVQGNVTITLEAEGDPSTFEMTLSVLRDNNAEGKNEMMKLVRYTLGNEGEGETGDDKGSLTPGSGDGSEP